MSDPAAESGAPTGNTSTNMPSASEKSIANEVKQRVPNNILDVARTPDKLILRLNKLLASPGGLSAFLSTFNYTLYLLVYLESKSAPLQARLFSLISKLTGNPTVGVIKAGGPSRIAALATLFSTTRVTLRLFGLFPMYAWLRKLLQGPEKGQDQVLYATALAQASLYAVFQFLENVALLTDHKVLPATYTDRWTRAVGGKTSKIYLWAYRCWFAGVTCDFVRLAREAQLERAKRANKASGSEKEVALTKEEKEADAKWWTELVVPAAWTPVAIQFSTEGGVSWFNLGIMGACGGVAGLGKTAKLWAETKDA